MTKKIGVLIVDDSAAMRMLLTEILSSDPGIEVLGTACDPFVARQKIKDLNPDVITLDVEMPRMDGITFLEKLMRGRPMPVIMVSSLTQANCGVTLRALEIGAVDFVAKPTVGKLEGVQSSASELIRKVKAASMSKIVAPGRSLVSQVPAATTVRLTEGIIAIGASTGGTEAIRAVLTQFPADTPGIVIVQHMPPGFTKSFAARLDTHCAISVKEAEDGDRIIPGHALLAPGGMHMTIERSGAQARVRIFDSEPVNLHRPSVDVLFNSCAEQMGPNATGVILTGMGADGARGIKKMREAGSRTIAQDESTCVVFGMPKVAIALGGIQTVLPIEQIAHAVAA